MADLAVCEWAPSSNRSTVDPVVAVARLDMPAATRAALVEKMSRHKFDDVVSITWSGITSDSGANSYDGAISNMNFAAGRICRTITRNNWSASHAEKAIVYVVAGRAFGYASACGNLFELSLADEASPAAAGPADDPLDAVMVAVLPPLTEPVDAALIRIEADHEPATVWRRWPELSAPSGFWTATNPPRPLALIPVSPVPEPQSWQLLGLGLAGVLLAANLRKSTSFRNPT